MADEEVWAWPTDGELIIGLVGPIGVDLESVAHLLEKELHHISYAARTVRLTDLLTILPGFGIAGDLALDARYRLLMDNGNKLCEELNRADAMAVLGVHGIRSKRDDLIASGEVRRAFIVRQLKRQEEVEMLRRLYGENFVLVGALTDKASRAERLANRIANSDHAAAVTDDHRSRAYSLMDRDEQEGLTRGQNLRDTFSMADYFIDPSEPERLQHDIVRFVDLLFGRRVRTPTKDEYAMFHAFGSALRSGQLGRQVGEGDPFGGPVAMRLGVGGSWSTVGRTRLG